MTKVRAEDVVSTPLSLNYRYMQWVCARFERLHLLCQDNRRVFATIFGKAHWKLRGEFFYHAWQIEFEGYLFVIYTAGQKGTVYEYAGQKLTISKATGVFTRFSQCILELIKKENSQ